MPNGFYVGWDKDRVLVGSVKTRPTGPGVPGTRILNAAPEPGGYEGWVCMADGRTWRGYGLIERMPEDP
jgi:hypothetical protein